MCRAQIYWEAFVGCHFVCTAVLSTSCIFPFFPLDAMYFIPRNSLDSPEDGTCIDESENSTRQYRLDTVAGTHNCGNCCCEKGPAHTQGVEYCNRKGIPYMSHLCSKFPVRVAFPFALARVSGCVKQHLHDCSSIISASVTSSPSSKSSRL